ncbi:diacylglycerol kinase family protein [Bdellovibrio sp. 22V]|uniref:diacylglycerol/lipid kinase family protein n=1 Tax=Bdellovibrio TaxID=958 RepID=UPI0025438985|nr:diacylglycerol kinase family protein [Bdellovibrio sp. 22V]WII72855.1 diacylglycerol kinase family protein [Bdellovibrio sp. 22V]
MRVSVLINSKAGSVNAELIEAKVRESLFRCDLRFCRPQTLTEMCDFLHGERAAKTDYIIICGGDGTINVALQCLMKCQDSSHIPPIAIIRSGTANDLAHEIGVSKRIDQAIRNIFEGTAKYIDVIEVEAEGAKAYMLTNGGLGLPAKAAELANKFRSHLQNLANCPKSAKAYKYLAQKSYYAVKRMGPSVYSLMTAEAIRTWNPEGWGLEVSIPGKVNIETQSPIVLVNNQQTIGSSFLPAPYTSNSDGTVNLLLSETKNIPEHALAALHIRRGSVEKFPAFKSFELKEFKLRSVNPERKLTFFGDGEILHKNVQELSIRCIHGGLPVMVRS